MVELRRDGHVRRPDEHHVDPGQQNLVERIRRTEVLDLRDEQRPRGVFDVLPQGNRSEPPACMSCARRPAALRRERQRGARFEDVVLATHVRDLDPGRAGLEDAVDQGGIGLREPHERRETQAPGTPEQVERIPFAEG